MLYPQQTAFLTPLIAFTTKSAFSSLRNSSCILAVFFQLSYFHKSEFLTSMVYFNHKIFLSRFTFLPPFKCGMNGANKINTFSSGELLEFLFHFFFKFSFSRPISTKHRVFWKFRPFLHQIV